MADNNPRGFKPSRHLNGGSRFRSKRYVVSSAYGTNLFLGDAVALTSGKITALAAGGTGIGVLKAVYAANGRPLTHNQPDNGPYRIGTLSADNVVEVYDDPGIVFQVQANATAATANVGQVANLSAGTGNKSTGLSGHELNIADATAAATAAGGSFRIVGLSPVERGIFGANNDVEVVFELHTYKGGQ